MSKCTCKSAACALKTISLTAFCEEVVMRAVAMKRLRTTSWPRSTRVVPGVESVFITRCRARGDWEPDRVTMMELWMSVMAGNGDGRRRNGREEENGAWEM